MRRLIRIDFGAGCERLCGQTGRGAARNGGHGLQTGSNSSFEQVGVNFGFQTGNFSFNKTVSAWRRLSSAALRRAPARTSALPFRFLAARHC